VILKACAVLLLLRQERADKSRVHCSGPHFAVCVCCRLGKNMIINAPTVFSTAWTIAKTWLDERTKQKISIYTSEKSVRCPLLQSTTVTLSSPCP